jgi:hypothetical protein
MLQVFHAKWHNRLPEDESSEGCGGFILHRSEDQLKIEVLKESMRQQDGEMRKLDEAMTQRDEFYTQAFTQHLRLVDLTI